MIVLDGCSGAGGAARGYADAGHTVYGIDSNPALERDYLESGASGFLEADILEALAAPWIAKADFIHVSPPCQFYSAMAACRPGVAVRYPDLIGPVRKLLIASGKPFVIENVEAARPWLKDPVILCAQMFRPGVLLYRHRLFECGGGFTLAAPPAPPSSLTGAAELERYLRRDCAKLALAVRSLTGWDLVDTYDGVRGTHVLARLPDGRLLDVEGIHDAAEYPAAQPFTACDCESYTEWDQPDVLADATRLLSTLPGPRKACGWPHPVPASRAGHWKPGTAISVAGHVGNVALAREVMEISWTTREELAEAVPPYYTEWVGRQLGEGPGGRMREGHHGITAH